MQIIFTGPGAGRLTSTQAARLRRLLRRLSAHRWERACRRFLAVTGRQG